MLEREKLKRNYREYLDKYSSGYDIEALNYIRENFFRYRNSFNIPDILMQVYSELGVFDDKDNIYLIHLNKIQSIFDINCNVLEIGGGMLPAFANLLAQAQIRVKKGTLTVYDPMLCTTKSKYKNLILKKEEFTKKTIISNYDLLVGIMPCGATEDMIVKACKERKDFYIQMCGCTHFTRDQIYKYGLSLQTFQKYIIDLAQDICKETINVDKVNNNFYDYPILYKKF